MKPNNKFKNQPRSFWANIRSISETIGYTSRADHGVKIPTIYEIKKAMLDRELSYSHLIDSEEKFTDEGILINEYFIYRADILNNYVRPRLMDSSSASELFNSLKIKFGTNYEAPMNKQSGIKKKPAYFTGIINMIVDQYCNGIGWINDPRALTTLTREGKPLRTLARRVDGAFPSTVNPIAIWEIKEYYYTTTFGSRVADGVYETLLDGMELEELFTNEKVDVCHLLMVDAYLTWWQMGKSYLCRIIDMLNMGYVDEVLFGCEVVDELPEAVEKWVEIYKKRNR